MLFAGADAAGVDHASPVKMTHERRDSQREDRSSLCESVVQFTGRPELGCWQCKNAIRHNMILDPSGRPTCMSFEAAWRDSVQMAKEMLEAAKPLRPSDRLIWARVEVKLGAAKEDEEEEIEEEEEEEEEEEGDGDE
ncbi:hypothetical protein K523DRAFT_334831 [Schizophyllum commune Tattone D]|nr:hypothetical protein K523DRAFT_334831 [Schizophyllum commune Tattone D]